LALAQLHSRACVGVEAPAVTVELHLAGGLPGRLVVGPIDPNRGRPLPGTRPATFRGAAAASGHEQAAILIDIGWWLVAGGCGPDADTSEPSTYRVTLVSV
jgi:magnesium chelatase family protein